MTRGNAVVAGAAAGVVVAAEAGGVRIGIYDGYSYDDDCWWSPRRARWICPYYD